MSLVAPLASRLRNHFWRKRAHPQYFSTMRIPILYGREFAATGTWKSPAVAVVNETLARNFITHTGDMSKALGNIIPFRDAVPIQVVDVGKDSSFTK